MKNCINNISITKKESKQLCHKNSLKSILFSGLLGFGFLGTGFIGEVYAVKRSNTMDDVPTKRQQAQKIEISFEKIINELPLTKESKQTLLANKNKIRSMLFQFDTDDSVIGTGIYVNDGESTDFLKNMRLDKMQKCFKTELREEGFVLFNFTPKTMQDLSNRILAYFLKNNYDKYDTSCLEKDNDKVLNFIKKNLIYKSREFDRFAYPVFIINDEKINRTLKLTILTPEHMTLKLDSKK